MNVAVANVPSETVGSPRSSRQSVSRLTKRRAAMSRDSFYRSERQPEWPQITTRSRGLCTHPVHPFPTRAFRNYFAQFELRRAGWLNKGKRFRCWSRYSSGLHS